MRLTFIKLRVLVLLGFVFFLTACTTQSVPLPANLPRDAAVIRIVRPSSLWAGVLTAPVYVNGRYIGRVSNGGQLSTMVAPGPVVVATSGGSATILLQKHVRNAVHFNAKPSRTYVIRVTSPYQINFTTPIGNAAFKVELINRY